MALFIIFFLLACLWAEGDQREIYPVIYGGVPIRVEAAPYIALYMSDTDEGQWKCGASIITKRHLISAAHCYLGGSAKHYVIVGKDNSNRNGQRYNIEGIIVHPRYNFETLDNDILVLKLAESLVFSSRVQPIELAERNLVIPQGAMLDVMGYGVTIENADNEDLYKISIPYVDKGTCESMAFTKITMSMLCAGSDPYKNSHKGDSGGPLVYGKTLVGVVSFGFPTNRDIPFSVYARVSALRDFIDDALRTLN